MGAADADGGGSEICNKTKIVMPGAPAYKAMKGGVCGIACILAGLMAGTSSTALGQPSNPDRIAAVVYCYDRLRNIVTRSLAAECKGEIVSEDRAEDINQERQKRLQGILEEKPQPAFAGLKRIAMGTAFFINKNGNLLTNYHVVQDCKAISIETPARDVTPAAVLAVDVANDLALLTTNRQSLGVVRFRPNFPILPGAAVATVGYPNQGLPPVTPSITTGHFLRMIDIDKDRQRIAIEADIRHGNSGGPLLDEDGLVIGVVFAKLDTVKAYKLTKQVVDNLGYAIPDPTVRAFLDRNVMSYAIGTVAAPMSPEQILEAGKAYIARAGCWK